MKVSVQLATAIALFLLLGCSGETGLGVSGEPAPVLVDEPTPQRILVIGGTRGVGLETVRLSLARGHRVTAMARNPEKMPLQDDGLTTIAGDILDPQQVADAVRDQDAVVIVIGMGPTRDPVSLFSAGTANVLTAMESADVRRLVVVTGIGAGDSKGHGTFFYERLLFPLALRTIYEDKDRQEALIRQAEFAEPLLWTVVRPGFFNNDPARQRYRVVTDLEGLTAGDIPRADVAHFIVAAIESGLYIGETPLISE